MLKQHRTLDAEYDNGYEARGHKIWKLGLELAPQSLNSDTEIDEKFGLSSVTRRFERMAFLDLRVKREAN